MKVLFMLAVYCGGGMNGLYWNFRLSLFFLFVDEEKSREEETKVFDISVLLNFLLFAVVHRVLV